MTMEKSRPELKGTTFEAADGEGLNTLSFRTRVAVLWVAVALALSGSMLLYLFMPGALEELLSGEVEGETLDDAMGFLFAGLVIIPLMMAAVTLAAVPTIVVFLGAQRVIMKGIVLPGER